MRYAAKKSPLVVCVITLPAILLIALAAWLVMMPGRGVVSMIGGTAVAGVAIMLLWVLLGTCYKLTPTHLIARRGPFWQRIKLGNISHVYTKAVRWRDLVGSYALSADAVLIEYWLRPGSLRIMIISPKDQARFLSDLYDERGQIALRRTLVSLGR